MARRRGWRRYRSWIALAVLVAIGGAVFMFVRSAEPEAQATTYETSQAATGTVSVTVSGTGNLDVREAVEAWPKVSGTVASISAVVGTMVKKGETLYTLESESAEQNTAQAVAQKSQSWESVDRAKLALTQAENQLAALEAKSDDPGSKVTSAQIEEAEQQVDVAEAGLSSAYASYDAAKLAYEDALEAEKDLVVKAPWAGRVWEVNVDVGDSVSGSGNSSSGSGANGADSTDTSSANAGTTSAPVVIAKGGKLGAELSINEVDISSLKVGQEAELTFDAVPDLTLTGKVDEVGRGGTVNQGVVTYSVWVTLDVNDSRLKTGMSSAATIVTAFARDVLLVPNGAIKTDDQGSYVQVMDQGATAPRNVYVTTGLEGDTQTAIEQGLEPGAAVVTKTVTADSAGTSSGASSGNQSTTRGEGGGFFMMDGGGPPAGAPGGN